MQTFEAVVAVLDKATGPLSRIETKLAGTMAPIRRLKTGFASLGENLGFSKISEAAEGAKQHINTLGESLGGLAAPLQMLAGVASVGGLIELTKRSAEAGAALYEGSIKTGVAVDQLARLHYAAQQTGTDADTLDKSLAYLSRTMGDALTGHNQQALLMFNHLGISMRDAAGNARKPAEVFADLANAVQRFKGNDAVLQQIAKVFSTRGGDELLPMLSEGAAGLKKFGNEYDKFHGTFTAKMAQDADSLNRSWGELGTSVSGLSDAIGLSLGPKLQPAIDGMSKFIAVHREFVADLVLSGASLVGIAALSSGPVLNALKGLAKPMIEFGGVFARGLKLGIGAFGNFVTALRAGYGVTESAQLAFNASVLANPYVLVAAILVGAAVVVATHWEAFKHNAVAIWNFIADGVSSAARGIAAWFSRMGSSIIATWDQVEAAVVKMWNGITGVFTSGWAKLKPIVEPIIAAGEKLAGLLGIHPSAKPDVTASSPSPAAAAPGAPSITGLPPGIARPLATPDARFAQRFRPESENMALGAAGLPTFGAPLQLARIPPPAAPGAPGAGGAAGAPGARGQVDVNVKIDGLPRGSTVATRSRGDVSADADVGYAWATP